MLDGIPQDGKGFAQRIPLIYAISNEKYVIGAHLNAAANLLNGGIWAP
jgi:hypothetical protein